MNGSTPAVVVIDMQDAFFSSGPLAPRARDLAARCSELHHWAGRRGVPVFQVRTEHLPDRSTWTLNMLEDDMGFLIAGDSDAQALPGLASDGAIEVVKTRDSAFHGTDFENQLRARGIDLLIVAGVSTHTCVAATAADAYAHDFHVVLVEDAIASHRPELHEPTLEMLCDEFRFRRLCTSDLLNGPDSLISRTG
ncbi:MULTISPECIES: cysteine hydrolase family protein [unclassified Nocardioides]|uniref:cysteine hydrolase family protein n=1 Tax=unclassified Nocardioides TaxID=2615069 RepID=UPI0006FCF01A|nr:MULTISPECIES: isochorismatase family cysteine hydrolase [unclassified Nocardioides]KQY51627.1 hypothetical protein ASD30_19870 [Nocardioides sp. Root140]KRF10971.1 hypothetical protein ASH02_19220 [Nocardioides sp. Soil796]